MPSNETALYRGEIRLQYIYTLNMAKHTLLFIHVVSNRNSRPKRSKQEGKINFTFLKIMNKSGDQHVGNSLRKFCYETYIIDVSN